MDLNCNNCNKKTKNGHNMVCPNCGKLMCENCAKNTLNICPNCYYDLELR